MRIRLLGITSAICLLLQASLLWAGAETKNAPTIIIRAKSIAQQMADLEYLGRLAGTSDAMKPFMDGYQAKLKGNSLDGIDITRPIGIHASIGSDLTDSKVVLLLPIADQKAFLATLEGHKIPMTREKDGLYTLRVPNADETARQWDLAVRAALKNVLKYDVGPLPDPIYVRFADKYAHVTFGKDNKGLLDAKQMVAANKVLPANTAASLSVSLAIDQVPADQKKIALALLHAGVAKLKEDKGPDESAATHKLRTAFGAEVEAWGKLIEKDAGELTLSLDIDRKKNDVGMSLGLDGKPGTKLAKAIADLGDARSVSAGLAGKDTAMTMTTHVKLPEALRKAWEQYVNEDLQKELLKNEAKENRALQEAIFKVMKPTLLAAELDMGMDVRGPSKAGLFAAILAIKVQDGPAVMKTILANLPDKESKQIELNAAKFGTISIHKIKNLDVKKAEDKMKFGDGPGYFAARDDALMLAFGDGALDALKSALASKPAASKVYHMEISMTRFAAQMGNDPKSAEEIAKKVFARNPEADRVRMSLEGGGALRVSYSMSGPVITFFQEANKLKDGN